MRTYATVRSVFWTRGSGKKLRGKPKAQTLAVYLMTCSQGTMCGIFPIALPTIAHETGLDPEEIRDLFAEIREIAQYDETEELCWVPNAAREQLGDTLKPTDKRRAPLLRELKQFTWHRFSAEFLDQYTEPFGLDAVAKATTEGASVADACPSEGASRVGNQPVMPPGQGQGQGHVQGLLEEPENPGAVDPVPESLTTARIPKPQTSPLSETDLQKLTVDLLGMPREFAEFAVHDWLSEPSDAKDTRFLHQWGVYAVKVVRSAWRTDRRRKEILAAIAAKPTEPPSAAVIQTARAASEARKAANIAKIQADLDKTKGAA